MELPTWFETARDAQLEPPGDWDGWLFLAGRGAGKTAAACNWTLDLIARGARRIALVGRNQKEAHRVFLLGDGIKYWARDRGLTVRGHQGYWTIEDCQIYIMGGDTPDSAAGLNLDAIIMDELALWGRPQQSFDTLLMTNRKGTKPRWMAATTPRRIELISRLLDDPHVHVTRGTTWDNAKNLPDSWLDMMRRRYDGTRLGRQEIEGELLPDIEGALFGSDSFKRCPGHDLVRIAIGVDPALGTTGDETGIVAAGIDGDGDLHILGDWSGRHTPVMIPARVQAAVEAVNADLVVCESNAGGDWVLGPLKSEISVPVRKVTATKSKYGRLAPVVMLGEQRRIWQCADTPKLLEQAVTWEPTAKWSPDRLDALAWAWHSIAKSKRTREEKDIMPWQGIG